ncbi:MAG: phosphate signaling complex protein PhoU [Rhodobacter sp.]|nr:phosphate signaling complex protein PhoU [Rhodobacter sp.]
MQEKHISSAFDRDLEKLQALIMKMGGLVENSIHDATEALINRDEELANRVRKADKQIDALEEDVNQQVARTLALRAPIAGDLRTVLSVLKISANLERCGDYTKNLAKRTSALVQMPNIEGVSASIRRMARDVGLMLKDALDAYIQRDAELAEQVRQRDDDIDQMYNAMFRELLTHMMEDPRNITAAMHLHFIAKNVERMGDHVTSISEQVIYLVTGELPEDSRPKSDATPYSAETGD